MEAADPHNQQALQRAEIHFVELRQGEEDNSVSTCFPPSAFYLEKQVHSGAVQSKILRRPSFLTLQELGQAYEGGSGKQAEGPKPCSKVS